MLKNAFENTLPHIDVRMLPISAEDLASRSHNPLWIGPDFLLHIPESVEADPFIDTVEKCFTIRSDWSLSYVNQMVTYTGDDAEIEGAIVGVLSMTPGLIVRKYVFVSHFLGRKRLINS